MEKYPAGKDIDFTVLFNDEQGNPITNVTQLDWQLINEDDTNLTGATLLNPQGTSAVITTVAAFNTLDNDEVFGVRQLVANIQDADGTIYTQKSYYAVEAEQTLVVCTNSFLTYMQALKLAPSLVELDGFISSDEQTRKSALSHAYINLSRMSLIKGAAGEDVEARHRDLYDQSPLIADDWELADWELMNDQIKDDFKLAQLIEANALIGVDGVDKLREQGLMSYTVGEVKGFFRTSRPLEIGMSKKALNKIGKYLQYKRRLARA